MITEMTALEALVFNYSHYSTEFVCVLAIGFVFGFCLSEQVRK